MLAPDSRAILLNALRPPAGTTFDSAIATTFTLDLTATLIPALAFSSFSIGGTVPDPVAALESVRRTADRLDVFCQGGNIGVPSAAPDLLAFLEPMVHEVRRPAGGLFHPKVWFIKYANEVGSEAQYRLLVLTRNLTNDSSWDIVVQLDSSGVSRRNVAANRPLREFLSSLPERSITPLTKAREQRIAHLAVESGRVVWDLPSGATDLAFHFLDAKRKSSLDLTGGRHLVISPFVTDDGLAAIQSDQEIAVVSREEELEKLNPETIERLQPYVVDSLLGIGGENGDTGDENDQPALGRLGRLHAKAYVIEPWDLRRTTSDRLIIGSANATGPALNVNTEFLVEFIGHRRDFGIDAFLGLDAPFRSMLTSYQPTGGAAPDPHDEEQRKLENVLRRIAEVQHTLTVTPSDGDYTLALSTNKDYPLDEGWSARHELLTRRGSGLQDGSFNGVPVADITPFVVVAVTSPGGLEASAVVVATLDGDPADRLDHVLARQIDSPEKFLRFLYLLLSLGDPAMLAALNKMGDGGGASDLFSGGSGILELVVRALAESPPALDDLDRLVARLRSTDKGKAILPPGFDALWSTVVDARKALKGARR